MKKWSKSILLYAALIILLSFCACDNKVIVVWKDTDGSVLNTTEVSEISEIPEMDLPEETEKWYYTGWDIDTNNSTVEYTALRERKTKITWENDGEILYSCYIKKDEEVPQYSLPQNDQWKYTGWEEIKSGNTITFSTNKVINEEYFAGNVFQIVTMDLSGNPMNAGTGFMVNKNGWFITNSHVMEGAYDACAIFEIKNGSTGEKFTRLAITDGYYNDPDKDIFIGRIVDYYQVSNSYKDIPICTNYEIGDTTYSVGYPNSSVKMQISEGEIISDYSTLYDKLYSGISYICSTSYVAPGSSGGMLLNENFEIIGMTTLYNNDYDDSFLYGASIEAYNFEVLTKQLYGIDLQDFAAFLHPSEKKFINLFQDIINYENFFSFYDDYGVLCHMLSWDEEGVNDDGQAYSINEYLTVNADFSMTYERYTQWESGDYCSLCFEGYYLQQFDLDDFTFEFSYSWDTGEWYELYSYDINYSSDVNNTLQVYSTDTSYGYEPSDGNIEYAKVLFNDVYSWLKDFTDLYE